jgi:hypothetical protein
VTFERDIRPIVDRKCISCHSASEHAADLVLSGGAAFDSLLRFVEHREALAIKSYLIEKLRGQELHAPRDIAGETPHPANDPLTAEEMQTFIRWIDLGASEVGVNGR